MQRILLFLISLPLTTALSLANFQDITSILIPLTCQITYDSTIPSCTVADFGDAGCSADCAASLTSVAQSVSQACSNVNVNSNTLLGIVKNGGILQALCPGFQATSTKNQSPKPTAADSVTLPTASPGVIIATTSSKSTATAQSAVSTTSSPKSPSRTSSSQTIESTSIESTETSETTEAASTSTSVQPTDDGLEPGVTTATTAKETATSTSNTTSTTKKAESHADSGSGGGSPFDISSNNGNQVRRGLVITFAVAALAGMFLGR